MVKDEFLLEIQDLLQREEPVSFDMPLRDLPEWDSLAMMGVASFFYTNFSLRVTRSELLAMETVGDIAEAAGVTL